MISHLISSLLFYRAFFRQIILTLLFFGVTETSIYAQKRYDFSASSGVFTSVAAEPAVARIPAIEVDDAQSGLLNLGFTFTYFGVPYTQFRAVSNGEIWFTTNPAIGTPTIAPLTDNLNGTGGEARYVTTGDSPNRICTIEWLRWKWNSAAPSAGISFQVKLYESSNRIEFIYRQEPGALATPHASIGLSGGVNMFYSLSNASSSPELNPQGGIKLIESKPADGQTYAFTPSPVDFATPTIPASNITSVSGSTSMNLSWDKGNGDYSLVFVKETVNAETFPVQDNTYYSGTSTYSGWRCVYNGTGNSVNVTGLISEKTYRIQVFTYNGQALGQKFLTTTSATNPVTLSTILATPGLPVSRLEPAKKTRSEIFYTFLNGDGVRRAVFIKEGTDDTPPVVDNTTYTAHATFGQGSQVGTSGWYCVFNGKSISQPSVIIGPLTNLRSVTGLKKNTTYSMCVLDYNGEQGFEKYNTTTAVENRTKFTTLQANAKPYTFVATLGTFKPLTDIPGSPVKDLNSIEAEGAMERNVPIGFTFNFADSPFDKINVSSDGFITFNTYAGPNFYVSGGDQLLSEHDVTLVAAPFWDALRNTSSSKASYQLTGAAPNRVLTVEWLQYGYYYSVFTVQDQVPRISMQVKLYETSDVIEFMYRKETAPPAGNSGYNPTASIGLGFASQFPAYYLVLKDAGTLTATYTERYLTNKVPSTGTTYTFTPSSDRLAQTITFNALPQRTTKEVNFNLTATASSGSPITYTSSNTAVATISGNQVTVLAPGTTTITAAQVDNDLYVDAIAVPQTLTVVDGHQSINFDIAGKAVGDAPFPLTGEATSGLALTYSSTSDIISLNGNMVTLLPPGGLATIRAEQNGNAKYFAATPVDVTFCVKPARPVITVSSKYVLHSSSNAGNQWYKDGVPIANATAPEYTASEGGIYAVMVAFGECASELSDERMIVVDGKVDQLIIFEPLGTKSVLDDPFTLSASATSNLPITYTSSNEAVASISGNTVSIHTIGTTIITASQPGNELFNPATSVEQTLAITACTAPQKPTITVSGEFTDTPTLQSSSASGNQWYKNGVPVANATDATYLVTESGTYSVVVTLAGCASEASADYSLTIMGLSEERDSGVAIFPNPVVDNGVVVDVSSIGSSVFISLYTALGKKLEVKSGNGKIHFDMRSHPAGSYLLVIQNDKRFITKQLVKYR